MNYIYEYGNRIMAAHGACLVIFLIVSLFSAGIRKYREDYLRTTAWLALLAAAAFLALDLEIGRLEAIRYRNIRLNRNKL